jgi:hypothetical protein
MLSRLGFVLYWTACALAAGAALLGAYCIMQPPTTTADRALPLFFAVVALTIWITGRALRYVLAGR